MRAALVSPAKEFVQRGGSLFQREYHSFGSSSSSSLGSPLRGAQRNRRVGDGALCLGNV